MQVFAIWLLRPSLPISPPLSAGRRELADRPSGVAWFVVCNDDIVFTDPGFVRTLLTLDPETHAVVAPDIVSAITGERQNPLQRRAMDRWELLKWRLYFANYYLAR